MHARQPSGYEHRTHGPESGARRGRAIRGRLAATARVDAGRGSHRARRRGLTRAAAWSLLALAATLAVPAYAQTTTHWSATLTVGQNYGLPRYVWIWHRRAIPTAVSRIRHFRPWLVPVTRSLVLLDGRHKRQLGLSIAICRARRLHSCISLARSFCGSGVMSLAFRFRRHSNIGQEYRWTSTAGVSAAAAFVLTGRTFRSA